MVAMDKAIEIFLIYIENLCDRVKKTIFQKSKILTVKGPVGVGFGRVTEI